MIFQFLFTFVPTIFINHFQQYIEGSSRAPPKMTGGEFNGGS